MPKSSSLWCMWFLSGRNGFLPFRTRCRYTRTTSKHGMARGENARMKGFAGAMELKSHCSSFTLSRQSIMPMVRLPVSVAVAVMLLTE